MRMKKKYDWRRRVAALPLALCLLLCGCSGEETELPERYAIGEDYLPAINRVMSVPDGLACTVKGGGTPDDSPSSASASSQQEEPAVYTYTGLESGGAAVQEYVQTLKDGYGCFVMDETGAVQPDPDYTAENGEVTVGLRRESGAGVFALDIQWQAGGCTITPILMEAGEERAEGLTVEEAVQVLVQLGTDALGLAGETMELYSVVPEDGISMVDGAPCFCLNVYLREDHQIAGTFLVSGDGSKVYSLDRGQDQVTQIR